VLRVGAVFGVRSFAPILGFVLGAWTNSKYVDLSGSIEVDVAYLYVVTSQATILT